MDSKIYRVDPRMITPVALAMGFGAFLLDPGRTHPKRVAAAFAAFAVLLSGGRDLSEKDSC